MKRHMLPYVLLVLAFMGLASGCGARKEMHLVKFYDAGHRTEMMVYEGDTLEASMDDAGIAVGDKDYISVPADTSITEDLDVTIDRYARVMIRNGKKETEVELLGAHVQDALDEAGIQLKDHDYLNVDTEEWLQDGQEIVITHRVEVSVTVDGDTYTGLTEAKTVKAFLKERQIKLHKKDRMNYDKKTRLKEGMEIVIQRVKEKKEKELVPVSYTTTRENTSSMDKGKTKVKVSGVNGEKEITYLVTYVDGVEESREVVKEVITKEPVTEVILVGTHVEQKKPSAGGGGGGKKVVSRVNDDDCDGSGHGTTTITYSDGSVEKFRY